MLDHMFRRRALVYYDNSAGQFTFLDTRPGEQKLLLQLVKRIFYSSAWRVSAFIRHAALAHSWACERRDFAAGRREERGVHEDGAFRRDPVPAGRVLVDSGSLEEMKRFWCDRNTVGGRRG